MDRKLTSVIVATIFVLHLNCCLSDEAVPPTISFISPKQIENVGETVKLQCKVDNQGDFPVLWMKLDKDERRSDHTTLTYQDSLILRDPRFGIKYDSANTTYTLQISDLEELDDATYQCQVLLGATQMITKNVKVLIENPFPVTSESEDVTTPLAGL